MITDVPAETPVTKPPTPPTPPAVIVATPVVTLDQTPPAVASNSCVVDPTHTVVVPEIAAGAAGFGFTVIILVALMAGELFVVNFNITVPVKQYTRRIIVL